MADDSGRSVCRPCEKKNRRKVRIRNFVFADLLSFWTRHGRTDIKISFLAKFCYRLTYREVQDLGFGDNLGSPKYFHQIAGLRFSGGIISTASFISVERNSGVEENLLRGNFRSFPWFFVLVRATLLVLQLRCVGMLFVL